LEIAALAIGEPREVEDLTERIDGATLSRFEIDERALEEFSSLRSLVRARRGQIDDHEAGAQRAVGGQDRGAVGMRVPGSDEHADLVPVGPVVRTAARDELAPCRPILERHGPVDPRLVTRRGAARLIADSFEIGPLIQSHRRFEPGDLEPRPIVGMARQPCSLEKAETVLPRASLASLRHHRVGQPERTQRLAVPKRSSRLAPDGPTVLDQPKSRPRRVLHNYVARTFAGSIEQATMRYVLRHGEFTCHHTDTDDSRSRGPRRQVLVTKYAHGTRQRRPVMVGRVLLFLVVVAGSGCGAGGGASGNACAQVATINQSCTTDTDCVAVMHTTSCCGSEHWMGIRVSEQSRFASLESACDKTYPGCGCAAGPPDTDDGSIVELTATAGVSCQAGTCRTFAQACGQPCEAGRSCTTCTGDAGAASFCTLRCTQDTMCTEPGRTKCQFSFANGVCVDPSTACGAF